MSEFLQRLRSTLFALLGIAAITVTLHSLLPVNSTTVALVYLLAILLIATYGKLSDAVVASIAATLSLDYFFLPPLGFITVASPQDWVALGVFVLVSLVASHLSTNFRRQRDELVSSQREIEKQYALSRSMLLSSSADGVRRLVVNKTIELFGFSEAVLFEVASGLFFRSQSESAISDERLRHSALYGTIEHDAAHGITILPVTLGNKNLGSLGFRGPILPEATLQTLGNTVAIGIAQAQAQEAGSRAEAVRKGEELKSILIDALAHDLKTPLTAMEAATGMLLQPSLAVSAEQRRDLLEVVHQEVQGLKQMLAQAIHLARIDAKKLKLETKPLHARELINLAILSLGERAGSNQLEIDAPDNLPLVRVDPELLSQALKQLIDNAIKYSPSNSVITISAREADGLLSIGVRDHGQGLTELEQSHVFEKFYRGRHDRSAIQGTGMGLAIAREIVEAHGGSVAVESQMGEGSQFTITLHAVATPTEAAQQLV
jgi:two-component system sensor histidine kinase KdpD